MKGLRAEPIKEICGLKVEAVRDYLHHTRTTAQGTQALDLPASDVLYYELAGGHWFCVRPSGTEPKIKLYINTVDHDRQKAEALAADLTQALEKRMA